MNENTLEYDVLIIGGGPAGLACAIQLLSNFKKNNTNIKIALIEKGSYIGAHIISGAVLEPYSLQELLPDVWQNFSSFQKVTQEEFWIMTQSNHFKLPIPKPLINKNNYIISLEMLCQFLAKVAEKEGLEIFSGFAATELIIENDKLTGIKTNSLGLDKKMQPKANYQEGVMIYAKQIVLAEGCRGQLTEQIINKYKLQNNNPQTYGIGLKEIWEIPKSQFHPGFVQHSIGWPLYNNAYGGGFMYHYGDNLVSIGIIIALDYKNPWLNPYEEFQRYKTHPAIKKNLQNGQRISYGARALVEGGIQALPKLEFPGGIIVGDAAGFLNTAKIKGIHNAISSGMLAADSLFEHFNTKQAIKFQHAFTRSPLANELHKIRNIRPGFKYGLIFGLLNAGFETYISRGYSPWTLKTQNDAKQLKPASTQPKINYPAHDNVLTFDKLSSVAFTNVYHEENQPCHLILKNPELAIEYNYKVFNSPETRYCPAGVYEIIQQNNDPALQINAQNCIHCKTCDIKDPSQNIIWQAPEGGGGPNYQGM